MPNFPKLANMKKLIFLTIIIISFSCSRDDVEIRQGHCIPFYISDTYKFPIRPGSEEWKKLQSLDEKVQVCQIPTKKLHSISTEGLLETLLSYPFVTDYIFFDKMQNGFIRIKTENKGFAELYNRKNVFDVMTMHYDIMSLDCPGNIYPPFLNGEGAPNEVAFQVFEFFLFQDELVNNISAEKRDKLFILAYDKLKIKKEKGFFPRELLVSYAILGKVMKINGYKPFADACEKTDFLDFFIEKIPMFRPSEFDPKDSIQVYSDMYYNIIRE